MKKIELGQFFTVRNVFKLQPFQDWFAAIALSDKKKILEPFAGKNSIISLLKEAGVKAEFVSYDIEPQAPEVIKQNTLIDFPKNFNCVITNPPYISKVSASRKKMKIDFKSWSDLYELALNECLKNAKYVAAIIPESFLTTNNLKERLAVYVSLPFADMFSDTEHPVCLALFNPRASDKKDIDFKIYRGQEWIGNYKELKKIDECFLELTPEQLKILPTIRLNDKAGELSLVAVDNTKNETGMRYGPQGLVSHSEIKISSRVRTILSVANTPITPELIDKINALLKDYRTQTQDVFLTSFKGVRLDGKFRRRLDFVRAKRFVQKALLELQK